MRDPRASELTAAEWRARASEQYKSREDSFERCDTDGFLSQWAHGISGDLYNAKARIAEAGGVAEFPALFDADGNRVPAVLVTRPAYKRPWITESVWRVEDSNGRPTAWVSAFKSGPRSKMFQLGYHEGTETAPADAIVTGTGHGLSGRAWVAVVRLDGGYPGRDPRCPQVLETE